MWCYEQAQRMLSSNCAVTSLKNEDTKNWSTAQETIIPCTAVFDPGFWVWGDKTKIAYEGLGPELLMQKATVTVETNSTKHSKTINGIHEGTSTISLSHQQNATRKTGSVLIDNTQKNLLRNCAFPQLPLPTKGEIHPFSWLASSWQLRQPPLPSHHTMCSWLFS